MYWVPGQTFYMHELILEDIVKQERDKKDNDPL